MSTTYVHRLGKSATQDSRPRLKPMCPVSRTTRPVLPSSAVVIGLQTDSDTIPVVPCELNLIP